ncbi:MAG: Crp/Fnr family transcriptional regulator [Candidatus Zixiibacteriota bacterium]
MLTAIEKVIFLQNVDVFSEVPTEYLAYLAGIAEEVEYDKDDVIYRQDDPSDAMFLVLDGGVRMHRGDQEITVESSKDAFGIWALFDESPRVASATALEDCHLLRIDREDFVDLLADHVRITQGVLKALANHLRGLMQRVQTGI